MTPVICPTCGRSVPEGKFCESCGSRLPVTSPTQQPQGLTAESTTKKRTALEWIAIGFGGIILLVIVSVFIAGMSSGVSGALKTTSTSTGSTSFTEPTTIQITTPTTATIRDGFVSITTCPGGAQVFVGGIYRGHTVTCNQPFVIQQSPGDYYVELKLTGYYFETVNFHVNSGETTTIQKILTHVPPRT